jgi:hypothetical protein
MRDDYDKWADRKIILGPLFKYAAIGITIGVVMLTGIVTLERHNNTLDKDLANLKTQLARANKESLDSTAASTGAESEQVASSQTETPATEPSMQTSSITTLIGETEIHGVPPTTSIPASVKVKPVVADQPATSEKKPLDESQAEPAIVTNLPVTVLQPETAETPDQAEFSVSGHARTATVHDAESFEYEQPERLSHGEWEWFEQQRLRHEQWQEKVEQRRRNEFSTRKASQANHQLYTVDNRHESI